MEVHVSLDGVLVLTDVTLDSLHLHFRGSRRTLVRVGALLSTGTGLTPVEIPVAIGVSSVAR
jgi:hypothetical protein